MKDFRALAQEARAWVASPEGQKQIRESLAEAREITAELNKPQGFNIESLIEGLRMPFSYRSSS